jgi:CheY-like chemotaxis protein
MPCIRSSGTSVASRCLTTAVGITLALLRLSAYFSTKRRTSLHRPAVIVAAEDDRLYGIAPRYVIWGELSGLAYKKGAGVKLNVAQVQSSQSPLHGCAKAARILIADDDAFMRRLLTHVIERTKLCCEVAIAENGHQAWHLYQRDGADLIITDNNMPVMDGIALTKAIRQEQPEVPIIMVSGSADFQQQARAAGASIFLQKPFQIQCLLQNIVRFLSTNAVA